jgi:hypothetical protein
MVPFPTADPPPFCAELLSWFSLAIEGVKGFLGISVTA